MRGLRPRDPVRCAHICARRAPRSPPRRRPTAFACRASSRTTRAAGWPGPSAPTTGAWRPTRPGGLCRRRRGDRRHRAAYHDCLRRAARALPRAALRGGAGGGDVAATTPGCATWARPLSAVRTDAAGGRLAFQRLGRAQRRPLLLLGARRARRAQGARDRTSRALPRAARARGRLDPRRRRGHRAHHRRVPAQRNRNPAALAHADRARAVRVPRRARRSYGSGAASAGDETDGHVDNLACFVRPGVVLLTWPEDESDPQHAISLDAARRLRAATDARGRALEVVRIPAPGPLAITAAEAAGVQAVPGSWPRHAGEPMAGSYVNFYPATGRIVFPLLDERHDDRAARSSAMLSRARDRGPSRPARSCSAAGTSTA